MTGGSDFWSRRKAKVKVVVRIFEATPESGRKYLDKITMHCCVLPSTRPVFPGRATSLGSLLAATSTFAFTNPPKDNCLLKKKMPPSPATRSRLTPEKVSPPPTPPLVL